MFGYESDSLVIGRWNWRHCHCLLGNAFACSWRVHKDRDAQQAIDKKQRLIRCALPCDCVVAFIVPLIVSMSIIDPCSPCNVAPGLNNGIKEEQERFSRSHCILCHNVSRVSQRPGSQCICKYRLKHARTNPTRM